MAQTLLSEIIRELNEEDAGSAGAGGIPREKLERWVSSDDIQVMGAVYSLLSNPRQVARIHPPLQLVEVGVFLQRYFERCIRDNPESEWADSRYSAGWDVTGLFTNWWNDSRVPREYLSAWKAWLMNLYLDGTAEMRECIETATLEHILEVQGTKAFFADWLKDPVLAAAYRRSAEGPEGPVTHNAE